MKQNRCCLCDGKVVNGICIECGMHNGKSESDYRLNQSSCDKEPMTHVHHESSTSTWESQETKWKQQKAAKPRTYHDKQGRKASGTTQKARSKKPIGLIIVIVIAVVNLIPPIFSALQDELGTNLENMDIFSDSEEDYTEEEYDPYEYLEEKLPETGDSYQTVLTAGYYIVGADIPAGNYRAVVQKNQGSVYLEDDARGIYLGEYLGDGAYGDDVTEIEDLRLFPDARLNVSGGLEVELVSENAQISEMSPVQENPVTEVTGLSEGVYTAGIDFPAGTYDLAAVEGYGNVDLKYIENDGDEYYQDCYYLDTNPNQTYDPVLIQHVVIPEGYFLNIEGLSIELRPSDRIISEDYASYYE
ncbi:MAG: hypothetical protein ACOYBL_03530 [Lachnospiraceae bacterium]|jgi:hypothetical protein